jgi:hypothetical protein
MESREFLAAFSISVRIGASNKNWRPKPPDHMQWNPT